MKPLACGAIALAGLVHLVVGIVLFPLLGLGAVEIIFAFAVAKGRQVDTAFYLEVVVAVVVLVAAAGVAGCGAGGRLATISFGVAAGLGGIAAPSLLAALFLHPIRRAARRAQDPRLGHL